MLLHEAGLIPGIMRYGFFYAAFHRILPGRAVRCLPAPPQIRTSRFPAYGSSAYGFATGWTGLHRPPVSKPLS
ncbi:MAG TPA: hypothetical protein VKA34_04035, partial [Balneolales bacterium]|nr:hypothetical protein [Balneolales bacterium]